MVNNGKRGSDGNDAAHGGWRMGEDLVMELSDIKIKIEFENLIPKQTIEQFKQLEENMVAEGRARNPLVLWSGHDTLVDGHHRVKILKAHPELKWSVVEQDFTDEDEVKEWIIKNALGTRNLTEVDITVLRGRLYNMRKSTRGGDRKSNPKNKDLKKGHKGMAHDIAKELGRQDAGTGFGDFRIDHISDSGFHIVTGQVQTRACLAQDAVDDGKTALLGDGTARNAEALNQHAFFTGKTHSQFPFVVK